MASIKQWIVQHGSWFVGAGIAIAIPAVDTLMFFDPDSITDWRKWVVGIVAASVRELFVYVRHSIKSGSVA